MNEQVNLADKAVINFNVLPVGAVLVKAACIAGVTAAKGVSKQCCSGENTKQAIFIKFSSLRHKAPQKIKQHLVTGKYKCVKQRCGSA